MAAKKKLTKRQIEQQELRVALKKREEEQAAYSAQVDANEKIVRKFAKPIIGSGQSCEVSNMSYTWGKRGGYADHKIQMIIDKARKKGFKYVIEKREYGIVPDGSSQTSGDYYEDKHGNRIKVSSHLVSTKWDNSYYATLTVSQTWLDKQLKGKKR